MRDVKYKQSEFTMPWRWRKKKPLHVFILETGMLYFSIIPGREAVNEVLERGHAGGGMSTGLHWEPFRLTEEEYQVVLNEWRNFDLRKWMGSTIEQIPDLSLVFDEEIMEITDHLQYIEKSVEKYEERFLGKHAEPERGNGGGGS